MLVSRNYPYHFVSNFPVIWIWNRRFRLMKTIKHPVQPIHVLQRWNYKRMPNLKIYHKLFLQMPNVTCELFLSVSFRSFFFLQMLHIHSAQDILWIIVRRTRNEACIQECLLQWLTLCSAYGTRIIFSYLHFACKICTRRFIPVVRRPGASWFLLLGVWWSWPWATVSSFPWSGSTSGSATFSLPRLRTHLIPVSRPWLRSGSRMFGISRSFKRPTTRSSIFVTVPAFRIWELTLNYRLRFEFSLTAHGVTSHHILCIFCYNLSHCGSRRWYISVWKSIVIWVSYHTVPRLPGCKCLKWVSKIVLVVSFWTWRPPSIVTPEGCTTAAPLWLHRLFVPLRDIVVFSWMETSHATALRVLHSDCICHNQRSNFNTRPKST